VVRPRRELELTHLPPLTGRLLLATPHSTHTNHYHSMSAVGRSAADTNEWGKQALIAFITGGRCVISLFVRLSVCMFVCLSVCEQDYCESNELTSSKLSLMIGPTSHKNWLTSGGDPLPDMDSGSLSTSLDHCGTRYFRGLISISCTVTGRF